MKTYLLTALILALYFNFYSQSRFYSENDDIPWGFLFYTRGGDKQDSLIKKHKVIEYREYINNKNKKELDSKVITDPNTGYKYKISNLSGKKIHYLSRQKINNYSIFQWKAYGKENKQINEYDSINGKEYIKEVTGYYKNKKSYTKFFFRNDTGRIDSTLSYNVKSDVYHSKMVYSYNNDKLIETQYYYKGKLKTVQKYDCNPIGELIKKVFQSSSCVNTEYDKDGNKIEIYVFTNSEGSESKSKTTYLGDSDKITKIENYRSDNSLYRLSTYSDSLKTTIYYKKNGKTSKKHLNYFDNSGTLIKSEDYYKGKLNYTYKYEYNDLGLQTKYTYQYKNDDPRTVYFEYEYQK
jgi:hypothetical protein